MNYQGAYRAAMALLLVSIAFMFWQQYEYRQAKDLIVAMAATPGLRLNTDPPETEEGDIILSDHQISFIGSGPDGRNMVIASMAWGAGVVTFTGNATGAAQLMFQKFGDRIAEECGGKP